MLELSYDRDLKHLFYITRAPRRLRSLDLQFSELLW